MTQQFATIDRRTEVNHTPPPNRTHSTRNVMRKISDVIENRFVQPLSGWTNLFSMTSLIFLITLRVEWVRFGGGVWFTSVRRSILANCWVTEPVSVTKFFGDVGKRRRRGFFKIFSWKWSRIRSSGTRKELPSHQLNSRISSSNRLLRQPCLYVDTTFRNSIELSRYGHFTANPATREPRGECDETVKIARMIRPAVIFVYEQQKLLVYKRHWVQTSLTWNIT